MQKKSGKRLLLPSLVLVLFASLALSACAPDLSVLLDGPAPANAAATDSASETSVEGTKETTQLASPAIQVAGNVGAVAALEGVLKEIYEEVNPSVVHIGVRSQQASAFGAPGGAGQGSGFVWDQQGHVVTNNHVIAGADEILVTFADGTVHEATVVGTDPDSDLAVLKVEAPADQLRPVRIADSLDARVGELVIAIGNPFGQKGTMTLGIISALGRLLPVDNGNPLAARFSIPDIIQTDASINPGNSGGVLLTDQGELLGVTTAIISPAQVSAGIGYAVPSVIVSKVVPALISDGDYEHPYMGVSLTSLNPDLAEANDLPADRRGAIIANVVEGGPAAVAGLQAAEQRQIDGRQSLVGGDVITAIDGEAIASSDDLITYLARYTEVGQTVTLTVLRNGSTEEISLTLDARPEPEAATETAQGPPAFSEPSEGRAWLGITGLTLAPPLAEAMSLPIEEDGVLVGEVVEGGPAATAGLLGSDETVTIEGQRLPVGGDVITALNGDDVANIMELRARLATYSPGDEITLTVLRDGRSIELRVTLGATPG